MSEAWYDVVDARQPLTQGDLLRDCRVLTWKPLENSVTLRDWCQEQLLDTIVMTQACDLENRKVSNVVLCPILALSAYREVWENRMRQRNQNPSEKAWRRALEDIANGYVWNESLLAAFDHPDLGMEVHVVEFHDVYTIPRIMVEDLYAQRGRTRLRLRPPYREHLSQAFARFLMRVGLPQAVTLPGAN